MRLKTPKTQTIPRITEDRIDDRCYLSTAVVSQLERQVIKGGTKMQTQTYPDIHYALDQDQAPSENQCFDRIGKCMSLIGPGNVGRGHQQDCDSPISWRRDQFVKGPIFQHKAGEKHEDS